MKRFYYISFAFLALTIFADAQTTDQRSPRMSRGGDRNRQQTENEDSGLPELTIRAQNMNELLTNDMENAPWMRVIYREIDLTTDKNAPLYYPVQEVNGMVNLFTTIFQLVSEDKITVYKYLGDYESFDEENQLSFKEMLDNFNIFYEELPAGRNQPARYIINSSDVPSQEVKSYYVKEAWYFDQNNSVYDVKTLAICPIAFMLSDIGEQRMPMFWAKYDEIRPYVKNSYIMTSNTNNAKTFTVDDFFRRRMFDGEIVKTENLMNLALQQYCPTPDSMKAEQQRIENQLKAFNDSLWIQPDTTVVLSKKEKAKRARAAKKAARKAAKQEKGQKEKTEKSKATPTRSIRRS